VDARQRVRFRPSQLFRDAEGRNHASSSAPHVGRARNHAPSPRQPHECSPLALGCSPLCSPLRRNGWNARVTPQFIFRSFLVFVTIWSGWKRSGLPCQGGRREFESLLPLQKWRQKADESRLFAFCSLATSPLAERPFSAAPTAGWRGGSVHQPDHRARPSTCSSSLTQLYRTVMASVA
jgi:hypothetical protein